MPEKTYLEAICEALHQEMEADENVFVIGEDVGRPRRRRDYSRRLRS